MQATIHEAIAGSTPASLFARVATLEEYPPWMRLVHRATALDPDDGRLAWWVQLRAKVGPFARSKQLRMVRTVFEPGQRVRFERIQPDDRDHAEWILTAEVDEPQPGGSGAVLTMHLEYTGDLWSAPVLGRILDDEVRRGSQALTRLFSDAPGR
jgi:hypothetical protein